MAWLTIEDYRSGGWVGGDGAARSREYCARLEAGAILYFSAPPFQLPDEDVSFLLSLKPADSRLHKNISYRPESDVLRGLADDSNKARVHEIMRKYAAEVRRFVESLLAPYGGRFQMDYASFRPLEEEGRDLSLHKRNDLLHVDAFPSRPTQGARILRVFTNVNPAKDRVWIVAERFPRLAARYARDAGLPKYADGSAWSGLKRALSRVGLPVADRAPYDEFMLHFHDWLKENSEFQTATTGKEQISFPPLATWLVYTDGVPHAALSGQFAMEQTFIVPVDALVTPEVSPLRVLEKLAGRSMS
ncbi:MAG TPA: Kdo hydroxylase family protein [Terriglobales bacterium]|nr:Kdo hydroxylase family protein [Terriglobales bacterium]